MAKGSTTSPEKTTSNVSVMTVVEYTLTLTETGYTISNCQLQGKAKLNSGSSKNMVYQYWGVSAVNESGNTVWLIPKGETSITMGLIITGMWFASEPRSGTGVLSGTRGHTSKTVSLITNHVGFKDDNASNFYSGTPATVTIPAKSSYDVAYNANGGSGAPGSQTKWYGETLTLRTNKPSRTGYSFAKWNTKADGTGTNYNPGASYTSNAALTLYAIWYPTVTYNANGGSGAPAQAVKTPGTPIAISTTRPTRTGYTFSKWNTSADGSGTDYSPGASYSTDAPLVLYAQWTPNTYQVSFDANTGKHAPSAISRTYGQPVTLPSAIPVKMAADFVGWATNSSGTGTLYQPGGSYTSTVAAAEILYAVWRSTYTDPAFAIDVVRTDDQGIEEDDGDHALITVLWSINPLIEPDTGKSTNTATLECHMSYIDSQGQTVTTDVELEDAELSSEDDVLSIAEGGEESEPQDTKTSGKAQALVSNIDTDTRYAIEVTVVDSRETSVTKTEILSMAFFTMDFLAGGHGVAFGKPSKREMFDVGMQAQFDNPIMVAETDVPPTFYYLDKPAAADLPVHPCIVIQTSDWSVWYCDNEETPAYHQLSTRVKGNAESSYRSGDVNLTPANIGAAAESHTHTIDKITWPTPQNLTATATANNHEWSIDLTPGSYTGTYFQIWSSKLSKTIMSFFADDARVEVPNGYLKVTGNAYVVAPNQLINETPSSQIDGNGFYINDKKGQYMGRLFHRHSTDGTAWFYMETHRLIGSSHYWNAMRVGIDKNGNGVWSVGAPASFRNAIGAVNKAGDTMTGALNFANNTWNKVGDDTYMGDCNYGNTLGIKGMSGDCQIVMKASNNNDTFYALRTTGNNGKLSYMTRADNYLHVETWNYGSYGVNWWASDARMKDNIEDSNVNALELVNAIEHRSFDMSGEHYPIGYIAQELEELDPQLVIKIPQSRNENGWEWFTGDYRYQIDPNKVIPYLSKAIQELSAENDELKHKNDELESRLETIERKLGL